MATLIPALGSCVSRMTAGERRTAERLEQKLDADYLLWYDVAVGPRHQHPDFVVMHPRRGILILEVKDFRLSTLVSADKQTWTIHGELGPKTIANPLEQARQYAHQVVKALERDPQLVHPSGPHQGKLAFPWSYGVVLPNITRAQFDKAELARAIEPHRVLCQDEMGEAVDPEDLQSYLWGMFPYMMRGVMSLPQMDRVRWIMFPEVRVQTQDTLFDDSDEAAELPSIMRVMDLQQEQLALPVRGHRPRYPLGVRADQEEQDGGQCESVSQCSAQGLSEAQLTDNDKEFTDRFFASRVRQPTGEHGFDLLCASLGIEHRLSKPRTPRTNGMVERFNGRIADALKSHRFQNGLDLEQTLLRYVALYNH